MRQRRYSREKWDERTYCLIYWRLSSIIKARGSISHEEFRALMEEWRERYTWEPVKRAYGRIEALKAKGEWDEPHQRAFEHLNGALYRDMERYRFTPEGKRFLAKLAHELERESI